MPQCPKCAQDIPADAPGGLCPSCAIRGALGGPEPSLAATSAKAPGGEEFAAPTAEELSALLPQFRVEAELGRGGMGVVYRGVQLNLDRPVAIKLLAPHLAADPAFAERFAREARALARLSHPNIVAVHDFGQVGSYFYLVMELVDGANLRHVMRQGRIESKQALEIVPQICDALQYAHDEGIVHRDIKPENILVDKRGRVKIADFGLAKLLGQAPGDLSLTGTQQVMGTLRYMAPEQMEGTKTLDHRADIYSLGVVFYELLTGELPLGRFAPPSKKVHIDVRLDEVVLRALEKEPEQRYQHASDVKTDMETIAGRPSQAAATGSAAEVLSVSTDSWDFALRVAAILVCFFGLCLVFLPWVQVWATGRSTTVINDFSPIDQNHVFPDGTFGLLSGIAVQVIFKGYNLWTGLVIGAIFFLLGSQLLATMQWRRPSPWWYTTILLGAMAIAMLSGSILLSPPVELAGGSAQFPILTDQDRKFYDHLLAQGTSGATNAQQLMDGLRQEGMFDLDAIRSKVREGHLMIRSVPTFGPWATAALGVCMLLFVGGSIGLKSLRRKAVAAAPLVEMPSIPRSPWPRVRLLATLAVWTGILVGGWAYFFPLIWNDWWPWAYREQWESSLKPQSGAYQYVNLRAERRLYCWGPHVDQPILKRPWVGTATIDLPGQGGAATLELDSFLEEWRWTSPDGQATRSRDEPRPESVVQWMKAAGADIGKPGVEEEATALISLVKDAAKGSFLGRAYSPNVGAKIGPFAVGGGSSWGLSVVGAVGPVPRFLFVPALFLAIWPPGIMIIVRRHRRRLTAAHETEQRYRLGTSGFWVAILCLLGVALTSAFPWVRVSSPSPVSLFSSGMGHLIAFSNWYGTVSVLAFLTVLLLCFLTDFFDVLRSWQPRAMIMAGAIVVIVTGVLFWRLTASSATVRVATVDSDGHPQMVALVSTVGCWREYATWSGSFPESAIPKTLEQTSGFGLQLAMPLGLVLLIVGCVAIWRERRGAAESPAEHSQPVGEGLAG